MKIVVSQPMYLPWPGIFDQIRYADIFVHYDDAQFPQGRSFTSRVQIKTQQGIKWLTVPVKRSTRGFIKDVEIDYTDDWKKTHILLMHENLKHASFFKDVELIIESIFQEEHKFISDLNILAIELISKYFGFDTKFMKSSDLNVNEKSSQKLLEITKNLGGTCYITGHGAKNYLEHEIFEESEIRVQYMDYNIVPYKQSFGEFTPFVGILDLISYQGKGALQNMQSKLIYWKDFING